MNEFIKPYLLTFIPIFVAVDIIGSVPLFLSVVEGKSRRGKHKVIVITVTTATLLALVFMFLGKWVLTLLSITIPDFQIAGGILLFIISAQLLLPGGGKLLIASPRDGDMGVFPLATPLITGPAVLATTLIMLDSYGFMPTFVALILNMLFVWLTLTKADIIMKFLGVSGARAFSKVMYILLASIGIMLVRRGIMGIIAG